jgi:hypothetical protein
MVKRLTQKLVPVQDSALAQHMLDCPVHRPSRYWAATRRSISIHPTSCWAQEGGLLWEAKT